MPESWSALYGKQLGCGLLVTGVDGGKQAGVDAANPGAGISEGVQRSHISPLGKHRAVASGHVPDECGHLHGEVELRCDFRVTLLQLKKVLLELVVAKQRVVVVGWVVDNSISKLSGRGANREAHHEQKDENLSLHFSPPDASEV